MALSFERTHQIKKLTDALGDLDEFKTKNNSRVEDLKSQIELLVKDDVFLKEVAKYFEDSNDTPTLEEIASSYYSCRLTEDKMTQHEEETQKYQDLLEENGKKIQNLTEMVDDMKAVAEQLEEQSRKQRRENETEKAQRRHLEKNMSQLRDENRQKDDLVKDLVAKLNRKILCTDSEFDLVVSKLKRTRLENKNLKMEILRVQEENDRLTSENFYLKMDAKKLNELKGRDRQIKDFQRKYEDLVQLTEKLVRDKSQVLCDHSADVEREKLVRDKSQVLCNNLVDIQGEERELNIVEIEMDDDNMRNDDQV